MWQLESDATSISSGSTAASTAHLPTTCGEADAGTSVPPSKLTVWARLKRPLRNSSPLSYAAHLISAIWVAILAEGRPSGDPDQAIEMDQKGRRPSSYLLKAEEMDPWSD